MTAAAEAAAGQALEQQGEAVGGVEVFRPDGGAECAGYEREVCELLAQRAAGEAGGLKQFGLREPGGGELIDCAEQLGLQFGRAARAGVDLEARVDPVEGEGHTEQPPAGVHGRAPARAELGLEQPCEAGEGQYLGIERQAGPGGLGELALGLVAVLFGHEQHAPGLARAHRTADFVHDPRGLARAGASGNKSEHWPRLLRHIIT